MRDLNVDQIKKLWVLELIIRTGSLRKAALQAKVSPSAISQTLTSLEKSVGKPLLIRSKGEVTPTQEALSILNVVRPAFEAFDRLKDLSHVQAPEMAWLNFGTYESIAIDVLPGLIHRLKATMPHLRLGVRVSRTSNLLTMIRKGELCSALIPEVDNLERFYVREVCEDQLGFYVSAKHPIGALGWDAVKDYGVGSLAPGKDGLPRYYTKFVRQLGTVKTTVHSDSFEVLRAAAAAGVLVSVLPQRVAKRDENLIEIFPGGLKKRETGRHGIYVVSLNECDADEVEFLASEASRLMKD